VSRERRDRDTVADRVSRDGRAARTGGGALSGERAGQVFPSSALAGRVSLVVEDGRDHDSRIGFSTVTVTACACARERRGGKLHPAAFGAQKKPTRSCATAEARSGASRSCCRARSRVPQVTPHPAIVDGGERSFSCPRQQSHRIAGRPSQSRACARPAARRPVGHARRAVGTTRVAVTLDAADEACR